MIDLNTLINIIVGALVFASFLAIFRKLDAQEKKFEERFDTQEKKLDAQNLNLAVVQRSLPASVVHIKLTPSMASQSKDNMLAVLLDKIPLNNPSINADIPELTAAPDVRFSLFKFTWDWVAQDFDETSSYEPFCNEFNKFAKKKRLTMIAVAVGNGQNLNGGILFHADIFTLRQFDILNRKTGTVLYRGKISGRVDIVIMKQPPNGYIARHNVHFAIEVKPNLSTESTLKSGLREAITQLVGLCADNHVGTPPILLTDFKSEFFVVYLCRVSVFPLQFKINVDRCKNIQVALSRVNAVAELPCISRDFCRANSPENTVNSLDSDD